MSAIAWFRKPSANSKDKGRTFSSYCNFAYSALASFRMGSRGFLFRASCGGTVSKMFHHHKLLPTVGAGMATYFPLCEGMAQLAWKFFTCQSGRAFPDKSTYKRVDRR